MSHTYNHPLAITNTIAKHKLLQTIGLPLSKARELLHSRTIKAWQDMYPEAFENLFLLKYTGKHLANRLEETSAGLYITIDTTKYQVVFQKCTPTILDNYSTEEIEALEFWASFRVFSSEYNLPPTVLIYPAKPTSHQPLLRK